MIRRFICAGIVSLVVCAFILPIKRWNMSYLLSAYGIHLHRTLSIQFFTAHLVVGFQFQLGYTVIFGSYASFFLCPHWFALIEDLGIYIVSFDRPGYGESDPDPKRTLKSLALDTEELADQLELGSKFYVVGFSMGGQVIWSYLKYIPHRLAGATLIAPVVNYWWPGLPSNLSQQAFSKQFLRDQWSLRVAHHSPSLTYCPDILSRQDRDLKPIFTAGRASVEEQVRQQGEYESLHRDLNIGFGTWEFDPTEIENPFPENEGSVHIWQGDEDILVPVTMQRYIAQQLPWINYHELTGAGHMFHYAEGNNDAILKALLLGQS
ncbi:putative alpha/beta hydrolase-1 [Helianthus annuus]|nr:putative alpha/beta hydrolase-1 [Helianthus annuus]